MSDGISRAFLVAFEAPPLCCDTEYRGESKREGERGEEREGEREGQGGREGGREGIQDYMVNGFLQSR